MQTVLLLLLILGSLYLAFRGEKLAVWTIAIGLGLAAFQVLGNGLPTLLLSVAAVVAGVLNIRSLRRIALGRPLLKWYRLVLPPMSVMVPNSLGPGELLLHYGTDDQKALYLPRLARGEDIPAFALMNPRAGSDVGAMPDVGVVCRQQFEGKETLGFRVNWGKRRNGKQQFVQKLSCWRIWGLMISARRGMRSRVSWETLFV